LPIISPSQWNYLDWGIAIIEVAHKHRGPVEPAVGNNGAYCLRREDGQPRAGGQIRYRQELGFRAAWEQRIAGDALTLRELHTAQRRVTNGKPTVKRGPINEEQRTGRLSNALVGSGDSNGIASTGHLAR
jgi:hypothetical protein